MKTEHYIGAFEEDYATSVYLHLQENIAWLDGIKTRSGGFTRKARPMEFGEDAIVDSIITSALHIITKGVSKTIMISGIYLNYYLDGNNYTPNHSHPGSKQVVISLGATRVLKVGTKNYDVGNGDIIVFGSSLHGIAKDPSVTEGRISIALFITEH